MLCSSISCSISVAAADVHLIALLALFLQAPSSTGVGASNESPSNKRRKTTTAAAGAAPGAADLAIADPTEALAVSPAAGPAAAAALDPIATVASAAAAVTAAAVTAAAAACWGSRF